VLGFDDDLSLATHERALWGRAEALLPHNAIEAYTQALMDLGATLCSPRRPRCDECPLNAMCVARRERAPERYPVKTRTLRRTRRSNALLLLSDADRVWLVQRPLRGVWAGLWTPALYDSLDELQSLAADWPGSGHALAPIDHPLTHFDWHLLPWLQRLPRRLSTSRRALLEAALPQGRWFAVDQALRLGLPAPIRSLLLAG
jgi:A/G-specific adenine glycosylase